MDRARGSPYPFLVSEVRPITPASIAPAAVRVVGADGLEPPTLSV